jgi:hypothetical protein
LKAGELRCSIGYGCFVAVDALGLEVVESGDALCVEDCVNVFAPGCEAGSFCKGFCKACFAGVGEVVVFDDGAGESFETVECGGVFVAEVELEVFKGCSIFCG